MASADFVRLCGSPVMCCIYLVILCNLSLISVWQIAIHDENIAKISSFFFPVYLICNLKSEVGYCIKITCMGFKFFAESCGSKCSFLFNSSSFRFQLDFKLLRFYKHFLSNMMNKYTSYLYGWKICRVGAREWKRMHSINVVESILFDHTSLTSFLIFLYVGSNNSDTGLIFYRQMDNWLDFMF